MKKKPSVKLDQLALAFSLPDDADFENFLPGPNEKILSLLLNLDKNAKSQFIYVWGKEGVGRSHLAIATCRRFSDLGLPAAYLDLADPVLKTPNIFENQEQMFWLSLDNLNFIVGKREWEEALFHCFNRISDTDGNLFVAADSPPSSLDFHLPDLKSRFSSCLILQLHPLDDAEKLAALNLRAKKRGLQLPHKTARYLLQHYKRDLKTMFANLKKLADASLINKRTLTIPFVKEVLLK